MTIDLTNPDDRASMISAIADFIISSNDDKSIRQHAELILDEYIIRTNHHIWLVNQCAKILKDVVAKRGLDVDLFMTNCEFHDYDKLHNSEIIPIYAIACHYFYFHNKKVDYKIDEKKVHDEFENVAWPKHHRVNKHHVAEYYGTKNSKGTLIVPETNDFLSIVEMYADWMAMGITNGGTAHDWWTKTYGEDRKWTFTGTDIALIQQCITTEDESENQLAYLRQFKEVEPTWVPPTEIETHENENPIEINKVNEGIENFFNYVSNEDLGLKHEDLFVGAIDPTSIDPVKMMQLAEYPALLLALKKWGHKPDYNLEPELRKFGEIIDKIYQFKNPITCYRGIRLGFDSRSNKTQNLMGVIDNDITYFRLLKPNFNKPGQTFDYEVPSPLSVARSPYIAKIYGDFIIKTEVSPDTPKLVITPELSYLLQQMEVEYPEYRALNLSTMHEVVVFSGAKLTFEIVSVYGDISNELDTMKEHAFEGLGNTPMNGVYYSIDGISNESLSNTSDKKLTLKKITGTDEEVKLCSPLLNAARTASGHEAENEEGVKKWLKRSNTEWFFVYDGSTLIGMTNVEKCPASSVKYFSTLNTDCIEIGEVAIAKEHRGKGYGVSLVKTIVAYIQKKYPKKPIIIRCVSKNNAAVGCYKKAGFVLDLDDQSMNDPNSKHGSGYTLIWNGDNSIKRDKHTTRKHITFPKEEIEKLKKQDKIITTRVSKDYEKFQKGDEVFTPWYALFKISDRKEISKIEDHPYYKELTKEQIAFLSKYDKIAVLTLTKISDPETPSNEAYSETATDLSGKYNTLFDKYMYHGSSLKLSVLEPQIRNNKTTSTTEPKIFFTPFKGFAAIFCVDQNEQLPAVFGTHYDPNTTIIIPKVLPKKDSYGNYELSQFKQIQTNIVYRHNVKEFSTTFSKQFVGYIYSVDKDKLINSGLKEHVFSGIPEYWYYSDVVPDKVEQVRINATFEYDSTLSNRSSSEALAPDIKKKKQLITDYICSVCDIMDPSKLNSKRYHRLLDSMNDKEFDQWMNYVKEGKWKIHIVAPNLVVTLKNENSLKAADKVKCKLFHRLWMTDDSTGRQYLTDNEYLVLNLPVRRQQQFLDEKMSVPDNDRQIDGMTGQVTGDSKSSAVTNPEIQILAARGLDATLEELVNVRGGNIAAYSDFKRQAEETGEIKLNSLDPNTRSRVAVVGQVLLRSMMIENNIVE